MMGHSRPLGVAGPNLYTHAHYQRIELGLIQVPGKLIETLNAGDDIRWFHLYQEAQEGSLLYGIFSEKDVEKNGLRQIKIF